MKFPHTAPTHHSYSATEFKKNVLAIWIHNHSQFSYKTESPISSIWGFFNTKTKKFYAPVNHKTMGKEVDIKQTSPYSAMIPKKTVLESCFT